MIIMSPHSLVSPSGAYLPAVIVLQEPGIRHAAKDGRDPTIRQAAKCSKSLSLLTFCRKFSIHAVCRSIQDLLSRAAPLPVENVNFHD